MEEVKAHGSHTDCWAVVFGKVHNLTPFIPRHPGGPSRIIGACGRDATQTFINAGYVHDKQARKDLKKYEIGDLRIYHSLESVSTHNN